MFTYLPRTIEKTINRCTPFFKVLLLTGMRQVGKSTCLTKTAPPEIPRLNLDDAFILQEAINSTGNFFGLHPLPLLIDEIQRAPELLLQAKAEVDKSEKRSQLWLTGSQKFLLMRGVSESLAGRILPLELWPLSIYERLGKGLEQVPYIPKPEINSVLTPHSISETWKMIWQGAWPGVIELPDFLREQFFSALVSTYLERDIRAELGIEKVLEYSNFLRILALRTGQELRIGAIAKEARVSEPTVRNWISAATASGLIFLLPPYFANIKKQLVKSPKLYFSDTGLASFLIGLTSPESLIQYKDCGALFENFVVSEIYKSYIHNGLTPQIFFFRDSKTQQEIDLLIRKDNVLYPVEIKSSSHPSKDALKNWNVLKDLPETIGYGAVICQTEKPYGLSENCIAHSVWNI